jgi:hypothetical protein
VTVVRPIQRLVGEKACGRRSRDGKVDELRAPGSDHGVAGGGEEDDDEGPEERPQSEAHGGRVQRSAKEVAEECPLSREKGEGIRENSPRHQRVLEECG